jgi:hypothetical protein
MDHWQDITLALGSLILSLALVPSIMSKNKPALWTAILTCLTLAVFTVTYASLSLWYATVTTALASSFWGVLAAQKLAQRK